MWYPVVVARRCDTPWLSTDNVTSRGLLTTTGCHIYDTPWLSTDDVTLCGCWQVVTGSHDCTVRLWDLAAGRSSVTLTNHKKSIRAITLHPSQWVCHPSALSLLFPCSYITYCSLGVISHSRTSDSFLPFFCCSLQGFGDLSQYCLPMLTLVYFLLFPCFSYSSFFIRFQ